jgi:hypothetical protein
MMLTPRLCSTRITVSNRGFEPGAKVLIQTLAAKAGLLSNSSHSPCLSNISDPQKLKT